MMLEKVFYGRIDISFGSALLLYERKGVVQKLIHQLKYKGQEELGTFFGKWFGRRISTFQETPKN